MRCFHDILAKNFVKLTVLLDKVHTKELIWRNISLVRENLSFLHNTVVVLLSH